VTLNTTSIRLQFGGGEEVQLRPTFPPGDDSAIVLSSTAPAVAEVYPAGVELYRMHGIGAGNTRQVNPEIRNPKP